MQSLQELQEIFAHFPGIGPRQAKRFAYYLLGKSPAYIKNFVTLINDVHTKVHECKSCHRLFIPYNNANVMKDCEICAGKDRDTTTIMIVARDSDLESVEKSGAYNGLYFILGGTIVILEKDPEKRIRLHALRDRLSDLKNLKEIILSLSATSDGENTAIYIKENVKDILSEKIKITILGRGLSTGAELEYADGDTIRSALKHRE